MKCRFRIKKCLAVLSAIALSGIVLHVALKFISVNFVLEKNSNGLSARATSNKSEKQQKSNFDTTGNTLKKFVTPSIQNSPNQSDNGNYTTISNTFLALFSSIMVVIYAGIHKMRVRIANREDPDQTASPEAV